MTPAFIAELQKAQTNFVVCWSVEKRDGTFIRGTEHDEDIVLQATGSPIEDVAGLYSAQGGISGSDRKVSSDMSVDNMEVQGGLSGDENADTVTADDDTITSDSTFITSDEGDDLITVNVADIESGLLDAAPVQVILVNWTDPSMGYMLLGRGYLGDITRDTDLMWKTEVVGFLQNLSQNIGKTYGDTCDVKRFGDARCKVDLAPLTVAGAVTAVTTRRIFASSLTLGALVPDAIYWNGGEIKFLSGQNAGFVRQVKTGFAGFVQGSFVMWDSFPLPIAAGDAFTVIPGCDRSYERCQFFGNFLNFRGHGRWIPGIPAIIRAP